MTRPSLAARRRALIERCAGQRTGLAFELQALRPSRALAGHPLVGYLAANRKLVLAALGAGLGVALFGRRRLPGLAGNVGAVLRRWNMVRGVLGMLGRIR